MKGKIGNEKIRIELWRSRGCSVTCPHDQTTKQWLDFRLFSPNKNEEWNTEKEREREREILDEENSNSYIFVIPLVIEFYTFEGDSFNHICAIS